MTNYLTQLVGSEQWIESVTKKQPPKLHPGYIPGRKYTQPGFTLLNTTKDGLYGGRIYFIPCSFSTTSIDTLGFNLAADFINNTKIQLGLYTISQGLPKNKLFSGEITITSNGEKSIATGGLEIEEGWYYYAIAGDHTASTTMFFTAVRDNEAVNATNIMGVPAGQPYNYERQLGLRYNDYTYAPFPEVFDPTGLTEANCRDVIMIFSTFI